VIFDAARFGGRPGELRVIPRDCIPQAAAVTHLFPLGAIAELIETDTGAVVTFLGVQVANVQPGAPLSLPVRETANEIVAWMYRVE